MPIANVRDAREVEGGLQAILSAPEADAAARAIRTLFVETLDFDYADRLVPLNGVDPNLPSDARLLVRRNGVSVLYIPLLGPAEADDAGDGNRGGNRVTGAIASAAAKVIGDTIADEPLLLFTSGDREQLHVIYPNLSGSRPALQRMVAYRDRPNRTVVEQLANLWHDYGELGKPLGAAVRKAFNVQPVTEAFFRDYKAAYDDAATLIAAQIGRADAERFTQTLFNRLLFVHFVSRKGWLNFNGDIDYLNALWRDYQGDTGQSNFYGGRLRCLFFDGLNNSGGRDLTDGLSALIGNVPFLNGGLFEEDDLDRRAVNAVPDAAIAPLLGHPTSPGDPGLFNRYNFTVMEATPLDTEVAVDPEMLGKLFEETVNERHSNGAYYTPRPVVAFMCREAIKGYLSGQGIAGLDDGKIAGLIDRQDTDGVTPQQALEIANAVGEMKAVDPACGSGAFLLGMLQEIIAVNATLINAGHTPDSLYQQKLDIITKNIYGADKDGQAVSTAMLRLWLSLAVDYDGDGPPEPLPNLDLKLVAGDAIAGPNPQQLDFTLQSIVNSGLQDNVAAYTRAHGPAKAALKKRVNHTKEQLRANMRDAAPAGVVEWRIDFADVMLGGGFDVVIANPPYVQLQRNGGQLANLYRNAGYATFARTGDIYQLFYERGCQLLNPDAGLLSYITSNSWLKAEYGKSTRRYFTESHTPLRLIEVGKDVFERAIVDTCILIARAGRHDAMARAVDLDKVAEPEFPPDESLWSELRPDGENPWSVLTLAERSAMDKMLATGTPLRDWDVAMYRGVTTGLNSAFVIDDATRQALIEADAKSADIIKPVLRGRDIQRFQVNRTSLWLVNVPWHFPLHQDSSIKGASAEAEKQFKEQYPAVYAHLLSHKAALAARNRSETGIRYEWYALQRWAANYHDDFSKAKLFWMDMTPEGRFAYCDEQVYCNDKAYIMTGESLKYLCAVLNSRLVTWLMQNTALTTGMGVLQWKKFAVERIPVPKISATRQRPFIRLVDRILSAKASDPLADTGELEGEIDRLVYGLYGLTDGEVGAVGGVV